MTLRFFGQFSIFGLVFFVLKSRLGIARQWNLEKFAILTLKPHPRRSRGSQSGREKRWDESLQAWAEQPLGTDSHQTISKNSSGCQLLIGHKKCFVLLCPISEHISWVLFVCSYTTAILSITACLAHAPKKCTQSGNVQFVKCKRTLLELNFY